MTIEELKQQEKNRKIDEYRKQFLSPFKDVQHRHEVTTEGRRANAGEVENLESEYSCPSAPQRNDKTLQSAMDGFPLESFHVENLTMGDHVYRYNKNGKIPIEFTPKTDSVIAMEQLMDELEDRV